jgi:hypothetical protein
MAKEERGVVVIEGFDILDVMNLVGKKKNKFVAIALQEVEELKLDEETFKLVRKIFLDHFSEFTRSTMRALLGDIEVPTYHG